MILYVMGWGQGRRLVLTEGVAVVSWCDSEVRKEEIPLFRLVLRCWEVTDIQQPRAVNSESVPLVLMLQLLQIPTFKESLWQNNKRAKGIMSCT